MARRGLVLVLGLLLVFGVGVVVVVPASASQPSSPGPVNRLPSAVPSAVTPAVDDGRVFGIAQNGRVMVIGGSFTQVGGLSRPHVAAFDTSSGALSSFAPVVNGDVNVVLPGPTAGTVYIGGAFTQVNGVAAQFVALLDLVTGKVVSSFKAPAFDYGYVNDLVARSGRLYVAGTFTKAGGKPHAGLVSLSGTSGALDPFMNVQLSGHHNDSGSGAQGFIGPWDFDVTPDGKTMVVIGNFKYVNGVLRDQVAMLDLSGSSAVLAPWSTSRYAPYCYNWAYDSYVRGVSFSPDGSYFVITATGGGNGTLCDATSRFETSRTNTSAQPTWVDETGGDTVWGVTVTNTAVYLGGHNRWENNPKGVDHAQPGAVPRPGLAALDPVSGRPFAWNPGRKPLGVAVFAVLATPEGVWIGSNTDYVGGHYEYKRPKLAFFPYAGGYTPASTAVAALPATAYLAGADGSLAAVAYNGTTARRSSVGNQGIDFGNWRGAFLVGNKVFYGYTDSFLYSRTFDGTTFGAATKVDPYDDPYWSPIDSQDGTTFQGMVPTLYGQLSKMTGMTYLQGRLYYTLSGDSHLYSRWFNPDAGIVDETTVSAASSVNFSTADGMFVSGGKLYYGSKSDGRLRSVAFTPSSTGGAVTGATAVVSGPDVDGVNWTNGALFLSAIATNVAPTASFTSNCVGVNCSFDGSGSSDSDGSIASYSWDFGDHSSGTGATYRHSFSSAGTFQVTLKATDDKGATNSVTHPVTVVAAATGAKFVAAADGGGGSTTRKQVIVPAEAKVGDTAVLLLSNTSAATWTGPTGVTGWTKVGTTYTAGTLNTTAWTKTVSAGDPGAATRFTSTAATHASLKVAVYSGVDPSMPVTAFSRSGDSSTSTHKTPAATAASGDMVVSSWSDRSTATRTWTAPSGVTVRAAGSDSGSLTVQSVLADSGVPIPAGTYGALTAKTDANTDRAAMWTIVLNGA